MKTHSALSTAESGRPGRAFSIMELMLAVSLMGVIIFALYGMFHHTQKALRANVVQVDVMESGRAAMDILTREVAEMGACDLRAATNCLVLLSGYPPVVQPLLGDRAYRTNLLQEVFFLTRLNKDYLGTCYRVLFASNGVGTLSRFSTNVAMTRLTSDNLVANVLSQPATNFMRLADGIIHFRLWAYDADGWLLAYNLANLSPNYRVERYDARGKALQTNINPNVTLRGDGFDATKYVFLSNALPAYVELELGVLEPQAFEQFKSFPAGSALATNFLATHVGQVHLFRQRVPVRQSGSVRTAYP